MDIKDALENIATSNGWGFEYARRDYQNLIDATNFVADAIEGYGVGETILVLDPAQRSGKANNVVYAGNFMVLTKSDLNDTYEGKFEKYIQPLIDIVHGSMEQKLNCDFDVNQWKSIEVINVFDFNADGLSVSFNLKGY